MCVDILQYPMTISKTKVVLSFFFLLFSNTCFAFQQCPFEMKPCATVSQALLFVLLPSIVFLLLLYLSKIKIDRRILRWLCFVIIIGVWIIWLLGAVFGIAVSGECSPSCWYMLPI